MTSPIDPLLNPQNSAASPEVGNEVFIPFWIVLESLDVAPPDPFIRCTILSLGPRLVQSPTGPIEYMACDLELGKPNLVAQGIPVQYLIVRSELQLWANRIGDWFKSYPAGIV
jgi:hypothetical protein